MQVFRLGIDTGLLSSISVAPVNVAINVPFTVSSELKCIPEVTISKMELTPTLLLLKSHGVSK